MEWNGRYEWDAQMRSLRMFTVVITSMLLLLVVGVGIIAVIFTG